MHPHPQITLPRQFTLEAEFHDQVPFVWGLLDGQRCLFLFDSGGQDVLLNARYLDQQATAPGRGVMGATGHAKSVYTAVEALSFGEWRLAGLEIMAIDMQHLELELGVTIHGIIGFRHLIHYDWMVDYTKGRISFWDRMVLAEFTVQAKVPVHYRHHLPMVAIEIAGHVLNFLVDTGASMVLVDRSKQALVVADVTDLVTEQMASASAIEATVESGTLSGFRVGELAFGPSNIKFADLSHLQVFGMFDGVIGYPLLSKYRVMQSWSFHALYFLAD